MGTSLSCVPQHNFRFSSKSFIRRNSSRLFRKKNPQEGQEKSNSIINILCTVTPRKDMSSKDLQAIEGIKWEPPFPYDPASGWKKSSVNVKNYGRMVHSSRVRFRFLHCQDVHDCYLDLFQTHLHFVSNNTTGLTYQGTLPLKDLSICKHNQPPQDFSFQVNGVSLNPIIVYCANQEEMDMWFELLRAQIEANGGTAIAAETYTRVKNPEVSQENREELRNSISREPIYEWEGSQRESLGNITYVTKVLLQHLPCQEQGARLLVMYPATLIILSEESDGLFYKGKLPLNMITVTTPCQDVKPNTFMIEGKLINPIVVSCRSQTEFWDWIQHFKAADVPVLSPPPPVYDIIYTPTHREVPEFDRWSENSQRSSQRRRGDSLSLSQSQSARSSNHLQLPRQEVDPLSPGYTEPLRYSSSRPSSTETSQLGSRSNSVSSHARLERDLRPLSLRYSSAQRGPQLPPSEAPVLSPVYNTPFLHSQHRATPPRVEKAPLVKSNSWNTTQSSLRFSGSAPQRHSGMCAPHQPLSPLYDEPCTPDIYALEEQRPRPAQSWLNSHLQPHQTPQLQPSTFQLRTPPLGRRSRGSLALPPDQGQRLSQGQGQRLSQGQRLGQGQGQRSGQGLEALYSQVNQRAEAVSRLKLLQAPNTGAPDQRLFPSSSSSNHQQYAYSPDHLSYLEPREPDDQEMDYDNIWEYDRDTGMIQPVSGIPTHRTGLDFGARGVSAVATHQRWS